MGWNEVGQGAVIMPIPPPPADPSQLAIIPPPPSDPLTLSSSPSMLGMAGQAIGETLSQPLPYVGAEVEALRNKIPGQLAEKYGMPGAIAGTVLGTAVEFLPKTGADLALQGLTGPILEGAGAIGGKVAKYVLPKISEAFTQIEGPIIDRWLERSSQIGKKLANKSTLDQDVTEMAVSKLKDAVKESRLASRQKLEAAEDALASRVVNKVPVADLGDELAKKLGNAGFKVKGYVGSEVTDTLGKKTGEILNDFRKPKALSFKGALSLKRKIDRAVDFFKPSEMKVSGAEEGILKDIRFKLKDRLLKADPTFAKANNEFAKIASVYDQLRDDVFSGKPEAVANRIAKMMRKGTIERKAIERIDQMGEKAAGQLDDILDTLAAQKASPRINPRVSKAVFGTGGGLAIIGTRLAGLSNPESTAIGAAITGGLLAGSSPRINFRILQAAKAISSQLKILGLGTKLSAAAIAPWLKDQILDKIMSDHLNASQTAP